MLAIFSCEFEKHVKSFFCIENSSSITQVIAGLLRLVQTLFDSEDVLTYIGPGEKANL